MKRPLQKKSGPHTPITFAEIGKAYRERFGGPFYPVEPIKPVSKCNMCGRMWDPNLNTSYEEMNMRTFKWLLALMSLCLLGYAAFGAEWKPEEMNRAINQTNFIVGEGCSGTLISLKYKLIITANHCVEGYISTEERNETDSKGIIKAVKREVLADLPVTQKFYQDFRMVGSLNYMTVIVAHKRVVDLALLQIRGDITQTTFIHVLPNGKTVQRGDRVWVVGNPSMLDASLSSGIVSSTTRTMRVPWADDHEVSFIQVDAAINPGSSGGSLYNEEWELIGIPAAGVRGATGLGFAIPYSVIREFLNENCYADAWDDKAEAHDVCVEKKK